MRLQELLETSQISELFQPGKKNWSWGFRGSEEASAEFNIGGIDYRFYAYTHPSSPGVWEIEFKVANAGRHSTKFGLTGTGNAAEVMSTVTDIMREFLQQHTIESLVFTAAEPSRQALYKRMISRLLPTWDIHTSDAGNGEKMFVVTSPNEPVTEGETVKGLASPLYHGGQQAITKFKIPPYGVFFTPHRRWAEEHYGPVITAVKVNASKVYVLDHNNRLDGQILDALFDRDYATLAKFVQQLQQQGYQAIQTQTDSEMVCVFPGIRIQVLEDNLDEGWKDTLTNLAVAGGVALGGASGMMAKNAPTSPSVQERPAITAPANPAYATQAQQRKGADPKQSLATQPAQATQQTVSPEVKKDVVQTITKPAAKVLIATANKAGLKGAELAQFVAQCAHETANFSSLKEYGGKLDFKKYDPKHNPRKAKILGNKQVGDGAKYHGRGYIQLTGRDNYKRAGEALGLPLEKHPELVEKPEVAAKVAVWYWENRVRPNVDNFKDTRAVTKTINSGLKGLEDRHTKFAAIMDIIRNKG